VKRIDLTGQKFSFLTAIKAHSVVRGKRKRTYWECICVCGEHTKVEQGILVKGKIKSCSCRSKGLISNALKKGGYRANLVVAFHGIKSSAKQRNYSFEIDLETFHDISQKECFYCGDIKTNCCKERSTCQPFFYNGLDRVDNNIGYTIANVVSCCKICNWAKSTMTQQDFLQHAKKITIKHNL